MVVGKCHDVSAPTRVFCFNSSFKPKKGELLSFPPSSTENAHRELIEKVRGDQFRTLYKEPHDPNVEPSEDILQRCYSKLAHNDLREPQHYVRYCEHRHRKGSFDYDDLRKRLAEGGL